LQLYVILEVSVVEVNCTSQDVIINRYDFEYLQKYLDRNHRSRFAFKPSQIDYINLHGTGTTYNDSMECAAVRRVFGDNTPCSSTKPFTGHCLGAAGAIEAALCWLAIRSGRGMPPHVVSEVDRDLAPFPVPQLGNRSEVKTALSNSFAFGGSNATIILG
jgi:3-oxoacyl-[acyl-carrier-protein] synthase-1